jgi:hypothetical protein
VTQQARAVWDRPLVPQCGGARRSEVVKTEVSLSVPAAITLALTTAGFKIDKRKTTPLSLGLGSLRYARAESEVIRTKSSSFRCRSVFISGLFEPPAPSQEIPIEVITKRIAVVQDSFNMAQRY